MSTGADKGKLINFFIKSVKNHSPLTFIWLLPIKIYNLFGQRT